MAPATTSRPGPNRRSRPRGFTLLEVTLTLGLLALLAGLSVYGFSGWQRVSALNEGSERFATLLRAARFEAASVGKRLRLTFAASDDVETEGAGFDLLWEPDPLEAPGEFVPYGGLFTRSRAPDKLVRVRRCRLTGDSAYEVMATLGSGADEDLQNVTFYPDGSSDSAEVVLISTNSPDRRGVVITLSGLTGTMTTERMGEERFNEWLDENE